MFYVLTEAGEYGATQEKSKEPAFMTEVDSPRTLPNYIKNVTVELDLINEVKKG